MPVIAAGIAWGVTAVSLHLKGDANVASRYTLMAVASVLGLIGYGLLALGSSGASVALIGIEESQRRRVERD